MIRLHAGRRLASVVAFSFAALVGFPAAAISSVVVFGDSISDSGNNAAPPFNLYDPNQVVTGNGYVPANTYAPARTYSNGPVWATTFASSIGLTLAPSLLGGTNFAFGGATTGTPGPGPGGFPFSLVAQTGQFLLASGGAASPSALYVVEGGGNNARGALAELAMGGSFATIAAATAAAFANDVGNIVDALQAAGALDIVVWNAPNLGLAPAVLGAGPIFAGAATALSAVMNGALALRLAAETGVRTFDIFGFGTQVAANPAAFGFVNVTDACGAVANADCDTYLWWDGIHPTTAAHDAIAQAFAAVAVPIPEPQTYALLALGLAALGWRGRRNARHSAS